MWVRGIHSLVSGNPVEAPGRPFPESVDETAPLHDDVESAAEGTECVKKKGEFKKSTGLPVCGQIG